MEQWYRSIKQDILKLMRDKKISLAYLVDIMDESLDSLEHFFRENDSDVIYYIQILDIVTQQQEGL